MPRLRRARKRRVETAIRVGVSRAVAGRRGNPNEASLPALLSGQRWSKRIGKARFRCRSGPARDERCGCGPARDEGCRSTTHPCPSVAPVLPVPNCVSAGRGQKRIGKARFRCRSGPAASGGCRSGPAPEGRCRTDPAPEGRCGTDPAASGGCPAGYSASSHRRATAPARLSACWSVRPEASARRQRMPHRPRRPRCRRRAGRRRGAPGRRSLDGSSSAAGGSWRHPARRRSR